MNKTDFSNWYINIHPFSICINLKYIQREAEEKANAKKSKLKGRNLQKQKTFMSLSCVNQLSGSLKKSSGFHDESLHLSATKNKNECDLKTETDDLDPENIAALEKIVQRDGLDEGPKRPKVNDLAISSMNRKALSLAADLHLWNGLIQNEDSGT